MKGQKDLGQRLNPGGFRACACVLGAPLDPDVPCIVCVCVLGALGQTGALVGVGAPCVVCVPGAPGALGVLVGVDVPCVVCVPGAPDALVGLGR